MAGDWIKMRGALIDHPKVIAMCRALHASREFREWLTPGGSGPVNGYVVSNHALRCVTTALLMRCWSVAREHGRFVENDLVLTHSKVGDLDEMAGAPSVGAAMESVGWAREAGGLTLPNFIEFNVPMTNAEKQAEYRKRKNKTEKGVTKALPTRSNESSSSVTTREEKRRDIKAEAETVDLPADPVVCPQQEIIALYHELLPANPRIKVWTGKRADHLRARWREENKRRSLVYWRRLFTHIAASPFLTGHVNGSGGRPFLPGLDWIVMPDNFAKIIEGRYHDKDHHERG